MIEANTTRRSHVLVTGFGPFPGVALNASARLAAHLGAIASARWPDAHVLAATLPTEWRRGRDRLDALWRDHEPDIAVHFGVSERARCFTVERFAYNACCTDADACGEQAATDRLDMANRPGAHEPSQCADDLVRHLQHSRIPAVLSDDPGRYLCNAIYYRSLALCRTSTSTPRPRSVFIHIPTDLASTPGNVPPAIAPMDWPAAAHAAALVIDHLLTTGT